MNIGILTAGGDCPGLNAVIRAIVLGAKHNGNHTVYGFQNGFEGLYTGQYIELTPSHVEGIETQGGTILGTTNKGAFGEIGSLSNPSPEALETISKIKKIVNDLKLEALIATGGDGSLRIANWVSEQVGIKLIGIPKTIDNDLVNTDNTLGFNTAVATVTQAIKNVRDSARAMHRSMIIEVMGRDTGWIALESGIAGAADCILLPEIQYDPQKVIEFIRHRADQKAHSTIIVIAEGATDQFKGSKESDAGLKLINTLNQNTDFEARLTVLGYIQRGGEPSAYDKLLGTRLGQKAVELLFEGKNSIYIAFEHNQLKLLPLSAASGQTRFVPHDHELIVAGKAIGIFFGQ